MLRIRRLVLPAVHLVPLQLVGQHVVPVHHEPRHRLVWDGGEVRVLDVRIAPGDTTLFHLHDTAILYVPVAVSPIDAQPLGGGWGGVRAGDAPRFRVGMVASDTHYAARPLTHRVANVGRSLFRLIAVINGGPGDRELGMARDSAPPGVLEAGSSWFHHTRLDLASGDSTAWHATSRPLVLVQPGAGHAVAEWGPSGARGSLDGPGSWVLLPAGSRYRVRNLGGTAITLIFVQVR